MKDLATPVALPPLPANVFEVPPCPFPGRHVFKVVPNTHRGESIVLQCALCEQLAWIVVIHGGDFQE